MDRHQFFSEKEAGRYYKSIVDSFQDGGSLEDKANRLRSIFDFVLRDAVNKKYNGYAPNEKSMGFQVLVDELYSGDDSGMKKRREKLHAVRNLFNNIQHHYQKGMTIEMSQVHLSNSDYNYCLQVITDLVEDLSGVPVPPQLLQARKELGRKKMRHQLEIILLLELFDKLDNLDKGNFILQEINKMIKDKDEVGLDMLKIHLVTYCPNMNYISPIEHYTDLKHNEFLSSFINPVNDALSKGLDMLSLAVDNYLDPNGGKCDKPWFVWLCNSLKYDIDIVHIDKIQQYIDADVIGFYPIAIDSQETVVTFDKIIPRCGPKKMDYKLSGNFFKSVLDTVQTMHSGHKIIKAK